MFRDFVRNEEGNCLFRTKVRKRRKGLTFEKICDNLKLNLKLNVWKKGNIIEREYRYQSIV